MNIIFEKTSAPETYGGNVRSLAPHHALKMQRDSIIPFPSGSIQTAGPAFKRSEPLQAFVDCIVVVTLSILATIAGLAVAFAFIACLFFSIS